jgi:hypothetical protein
LAGVGFGFLGRARQLSSLDAEGCAAVLTLLAKKGGRVPFTDLIPAVPAGHDPEAVLEQVQVIDGVMVLPSEPAGMTLVSELRSEIRQHFPARASKKAATGGGESEVDPG